MAGLPQQQIKNLVQQITSNTLLEQRNLDINSFLNVCQNYLNAIDRELMILQNNISLKQRIEKVGNLMHGNLTSLQEMLILSHAFEVEWNNFLNRKIELTWISNAGVVYLASHQDVLNMYASGALSIFDQGKDSAYRGYIKGRAYNFNPFQANEEIQKLQQQLTNATNNKKAVFKEGKRRYNKSKAKNMNLPVKPTLYWSENDAGNIKHWQQVISSAGFIGQGYIQLAIEYPDVSMNPVNGPTYNDDEKYIEMLAERSVSGDSIPGIMRGDVIPKDDGNIQFAIKQGKNFHTASITGNIGIAKAFIDKKDILLQQSQLDVSKIRKSVQNFSGQTWQQLYDHLSNVLSKELKVKS